MPDPVVPWNASWSSEQTSYDIRPCRWVQGRLAIWQPTSPFVGRPIFARPHFIRQRMSITKMICTVCGQPAPEGDRWWFAMGEYVDKWWATTEAPVHKKCGELAMQLCPHIRRGQHAENFSPMPRGWAVLAVTLGGDDFEKTYGVKISGREVIGGLKLAWPREAIRFKD